MISIHLCAGPLLLIDAQETVSYQATVPTPVAEMLIDAIRLSELLRQCRDAADQAVHRES